MTSPIVHLLVAVGILLLAVVPSYRSESRVKSPFGSQVEPTCTPEEYYTEPHDEFCEKYYLCNEGVATEKICPIGRLYHCEREECFPVSPDTDISEICCAGLVTGSPLPETTPTIPTESTTTPTTITTPTTATSSDPISTETSVDPISTETSSDPISTETSSDTISTETSSDPISTETSSDPISTETSSDPISTETSSNPISTETSVDPISTETSSDPISTETSGDPISTETSGDPISTETSAEPTPVTESPVECPAEGDVMLPDPRDCSKYIRCVGGRPTFLTCTDCNLFDIVRNRCVGYNSAKCLNGTEIPEYNPAVCSGCILSSWRLMTVTFILIVTFVNTNNLLP